MPFPIVPVAILAGAGLVAFVLTRKPSEPIPGGGQVGPGENTMSPQMKDAFQKLLAGSDPDAMETSATALEPFGFLNEAAQLRAQAAALRKARTSGVLPSAPAPAALPAAPPPAAPKPAAAPAPAPAPAAPPKLIPEPPPAAPAALPSFAKVTTSDPAPQGDLMVRPAPNAPGTPGVGAEKNGIVTVIRKDVLGDGVWSEIVWGGGPRLGPVSGFVMSKFLTPSAVGPLGTAIAGNDGSQVRCMAPSGCRLRRTPNLAADFSAIVGNGEAVSVKNVVPGVKREAISPGRGGWALVKYKNLNGWLPLEWLVKA